MKSLLVMLFVVVGLSACVSQHKSSDVSLKEQKVLILFPQGLEYAKDTMGFNNLSREVTQAFSRGLSPLLQQSGMNTVNIIDQNPRYTPDEKLGIYAVTERVKHAVILTLESQTLGDDYRLNLRAQWVDFRPLLEDGELRGVQVASKTEQVYVLRSSKNGDSPKTMSQLASDFAAVLKAEGRLKNDSQQGLPKD